MDMTAPTTTSTAAPLRPLLNELQSVPELAAIDVDGAKLGDLAGRMLQFAVVGDGPFAGRQFVPQTSMAAAYLSGPHGAAVEHALRGMLASADDVQLPTAIAGITLSATIADYTVNSAMSALDGGDMPNHEVPPGPALPETVAAAVQYGKVVAANSLAQAAGPWVNLGPTVTHELERLSGTSSTSPFDQLMGTTVATVAAHELGHRVTPPMREEFFVQGPDGTDTLTAENWLEEGTAQVLATWGSRTERVAHSMGMPFGSAALPPVEPSVNALLASGEHWLGQPMTPGARAALDDFNTRVGAPKAVDDTERIDFFNLATAGGALYPSHAALLTELLGYAGLDTTDDSQFDAGLRLLQDGTLKQAPERIAAAILEHRGIDGSREAELAELIRGAGPGLNRTFGRNSAAYEASEAISSWLEAAQHPTGPGEQRA